MSVGEWLALYLSISIVFSLVIIPLWDVWLNKDIVIVQLYKEGEYNVFGCIMITIVMLAIFSVVMLISDLYKIFYFLCTFRIKKHKEEIISKEDVWLVLGKFRDHICELNNGAECRTFTAQEILDIVDELYNPCNW